MCWKNERKEQASGGVIIINYETRYIMMVVKNVINRKAAPIIKQRINWENILKASDYQRVFSIIYHGMLGIEKEMSKSCEDQFYHRYRRELLLSASYKSAEEVVWWQLERNRIHALILGGTVVRELYHIPDMAHIDGMEILVDKKDLPLVMRLMRDMDYEQKENRTGLGILFVRTPGIQVTVYDEILSDNRELKRFFSDPVKKYLNMGSFRYLHRLSPEEEYFYRLGKLTESYIRGIIRVREILDFWLFMGQQGEDFQWKEAKEFRKKMGLEEFACQIEILCDLWFGKVKNQEYGTALELEEYILSGNAENPHLDATLLPYGRVMLDFYRRNRESEWLERQREWLFPPKEYMVRFFPVLEKRPFLLPFFWLVRDARFLKQAFVKRCKALMIAIRMRLFDFKEKLKAKFIKKELPEESPSETEREEPAKTGEESQEDAGSASLPTEGNVADGQADVPEDGEGL